MKHSFLVIALLIAEFTVQPIWAQTLKSEKWDLKTCILYARENNIQVRQSKITTETNALTLQQSKEALLPSVSASSSASYSNGKLKNDSTGAYRNNASLGSSFGINAGMTLFNGMKNYNTIRQNKLRLQAAGLNEQVTFNEIVISITESYLEILYANENLETTERTLETSKAQVTQSQNLLNAGSIAKADFSQVQAQYASDQYALVTAQNTYETCVLNLKQLLELDMMDSFEVVIPDLKEADVLAILPEKATVYQTALQVMPEIQSSALSLRVADYDLKNAKSGYYPTLSLNGSIGTNHDANVSESFGTQLNHNFTQSIGLSLSIPLYDNGSTRTSVRKAQLGIESAKLDYTSAQKTLLKTVESLYQDAKASQSKYLAAKVQLEATEESYRLTNEHFTLGMKNTLELLSAKNSYLVAQQTLSQAKFGAVLSQKLLQFYQNNPIEI